MVSNLRVVGENRKKVNVDVCGEINGHYETLYSLYLEYCTFSNSKTFEVFLGFLLKAKVLTRMTFERMKMK